MCMYCNLYEDMRSVIAIGDMASLISPKCGEADLAEHPNLI